MSAAAPGILYVEDERLDRIMLSRWCARRGITVTGAGTLHDAVDCFDRSLHLVAVIDWNLPGHSGSETARALRGRDPELPVIFLSGLATADIRTSAAVYNPLAILEKCCELTHLDAIETHWHSIRPA